VGCGQTHEPPLTELAQLCTISVISIEPVSERMTKIGITHDLRAPEVEQQSKKGKAEKITRSLEVGGFPLLGRTLEDATGLQMNAQIVFKDIFLKELIDENFGKIPVKISKSFAVYPFYYQGIKYPAGQFCEGVEEMDGLRVLQFIKTVPDTSSYDPSLEGRVREDLINQSLHAALQDNMNPLFWLHLGVFTLKELASGNLRVDFNGDGSSALNSLKSAWILASSGFKFSEDYVYLADSENGDGSVMWVNAAADKNPIIKAELEQGIYEDRAIVVPNDANPEIDNLAKNYWKSTRDLIEKKLRSQEEKDLT
jgi:hypothetical protein